MSETVLVTGAFGLVGSQTVRRLAEDGRDVVATDLDTEVNQAKARTLPRGVEVRWADLTDPADVARLLDETAPAAIVHLAAVIPPPIYRLAAVARKVNVDATASLVRAAEALATPPRLVLASSAAVYGARNPHRTDDLLTAETPPHPRELYGGHKLEAESAVRASRLPWVVLRLGGVLSVDPSALPFGVDALYLESALPADGRIHTVDVRDVARAFAAATTADVVGETLLIAGDETHKLRQAEVGIAMAAAMGAVGVLAVGRPGDPDSDDDWFITDWMDTARSQEALDFQRHSWPDMVAEMRAGAGARYYLLRLVSPLAKLYLRRKAAYHNAPGSYADPWAAFRSKVGDPALDTG
jgi:nucleoside-diphosphate-sugar epimerase